MSPDTPWEVRIAVYNNTSFHIVMERTSLSILAAYNRCVLLHIDKDILTMDLMKPRPFQVHGINN